MNPYEHILLKKFLERQAAKELAAVLACLVVFAFNQAYLGLIPLGLLALAGIGYFYYRLSRLLRHLLPASWKLAYYRIGGLAWLFYIVIAGGYLLNSGIL